MLGLHATAGFSAIYNLLRPINLFINALALSILPILSDQSEPSAWRRRLRLSIAFSTAVTSAYGITITVAATPLIGFLYHGKFIEYVHLIPVFVLNMILSAYALCLDLAMKSRARTKDLSGAWGIAVLVQLVVAIAGIYFLGLVGAVIGGVSKNLTACLAIRRRLRRYDEEGER
jgi:O-antigen/teichoic acid export membrane protein